MSRSPALIANAIGHDNAATLSRIVGGTRLHVPGRIENNARLTKLLGQDLAMILIYHFGDSRIYVPVAKRCTRVDDRRLRKLLAKGWSSPRIARELGCSENTVDKKRAAIRARKIVKG